MSDAAEYCTHMKPGPYPFATLLVLDDHLGPTDWLVRCQACGSAYLLEMLDWEGSSRLYRLRVPAAEAVAGLVKDLQRGSCDLNRASAEAQHFSLTSERLPNLVLLDLGAGSLVRMINAGDTQVPGASWRELPCDGSWIRRFA